MMIINCFCKVVDRKKAFTPYFQPGPLSEILTIVNLRHVTSRVWTCAESEFRLCWRKLCSSDNQYTAAPQTYRLLHSHWHLLLFHHWFKFHFLSSNLHFHSHDISFINVFDSFILVIMLNILRFKSPVKFGTNNLLDKSLRVLLLPRHLYNLTANGL